MFGVVEFTPDTLLEATAGTVESEAEDFARVKDCGGTGEGLLAGVVFPRSVVEPDRAAARENASKNAS